MTRTLNKNEVRYLKQLYFNEIDYSKVILTTDHIFSKLLKKYSAVVFDNTIVFTEKTFKNDFSLTTGSMALLVHEICHVWQYQNLDYRWYKAGIEHLKYGKSTYLYNIADQNKITDFRFEQQGEIMADYFRYIQKANPKAEIYENVIYSVIRRS